MSTEIGEVQYKHWELDVSEEEIREWITIIPVHRSEKDVLGNLIEAYSQLKSVVVELH